MSDEPQTQTEGGQGSPSQAGPPATAQPTPGQGAAGQLPVGPDGRPWDFERQQQTIQRQRDEAEQLRARLQELEDFKRQADEAKLTADQLKDRELEALKEQVAAQNRALREERFRQAAIEVAHELGFVKAEDALLLVRSDEQGLAWDSASGRPQNLKDLLSKAVEDRPYLLQQEPEKQGIPVSPRSRPPAEAASLRAQEKERLARDPLYQPIG
jgi:hypothetical protein